LTYAEAPLPFPPFSFLSPPPFIERNIASPRPPVPSPPSRFFIRVELHLELKLAEFSGPGFRPPKTEVPQGRLSSRPISGTRDLVSFLRTAFFTIPLPRLVPQQNWLHADRHQPLRSFQLLHSDHPCLHMQSDGRGFLVLLKGQIVLARPTIFPTLAPIMLNFTGLPSFFFKAKPRDQAKYRINLFPPPPFSNLVSDKERHQRPFPPPAFAVLKDHTPLPVIFLPNPCQISKQRDVSLPSFYSFPFFASLAFPVSTPTDHDDIRPHRLHFTRVLPGFYLLPLRPFVNQRQLSCFSSFPTWPSFDLHTGPAPVWPLFVYVSTQPGSPVPLFSHLISIWRAPLFSPTPLFLLFRRDPFYPKKNPPPLGSRTAVLTLSPSAQICPPCV